MELKSYFYKIKYRPRKQNIGPDIFSRAFCESLSESSTLKEIHKNLCHPGVTRLLHFVRTKNLSYSNSDVKRVVSSCKLCSKIKPKFYYLRENILIKANQPMKCLSFDYQDPVSSVTQIIIYQSLWMSFRIFLWFPLLITKPDKGDSFVSLNKDD